MQVSVEESLNIENIVASAKVVITGGREPEDAQKAVVRIVSDLRSIGQM
jgi:transcription initiation factor TFIID TATA-box-binding protein